MFMFDKQLTRPKIESTQSNESIGVLISNSGSAKIRFDGIFGNSWTWMDYIVNNQIWCV